jgi:DNA-binding GntR family transcriptional regulator
MKQVKGEKVGVIEIPTLNDICYERIKIQILDGTISWGERIDIGQVAASFGVSKFPVIKAIERLSLEKLVTIVANKGTYVTVPSEKTVNEVTQIRCMIENFAFSYALDCKRDELERELEKTQQEWNFSGIPFKDIERRDFLRYDRHFHLAIVMCTGNEQLVSYYRTVRTQIELFRVKTFTSSTVENALEMHAKIVRAVIRGEKEEAIAALQEHLGTVNNDIKVTL